jgi:P27 family predicted phage terminase small subunit
MSGPPPEPFQLRLLKGNPGKRPLRPEPPAARPTELPPAPELLDEIGAAEWRRTGSELLRLRLLSVLDLAVLEAYCDAYSRWRAARAVLATSTLTVKGSHGNPVANPLIRVSEVAAKNMLRSAAELGCTPTARTRLARGGWRDGDGEFSGLLA